jgi:signal transduction histidine kinase
VSVRATGRGPASPAKPKPPREAKGSTVATILIVDDSPQRRESLAALLRGRGHTALEAGPEGAARAECPDLVVADASRVARLRADPVLAGAPVVVPVPGAEGRALDEAAGVAALLAEARPGAPPSPRGEAAQATRQDQEAGRARQAEKMEAIGRLAGGIAHDFNNLLTVINGYSDMLLRSLPSGDPSLELLREIYKAGQRASGLTRQLLAFSRKAGLEPKLIDLRGLVADAARMLRRIVGEDVELTVGGDPSVGAVRADPNQIERVILNLVVNARDAMPRGGTLALDVRDVEVSEAEAHARAGARPGPYVLLSVSDTGEGMDEATLAQVFEPFFTTKGERGTGLGLATVHEVVRQCGGHVTVRSEPGRGTTFSVYLPRVPGRPAAGLSNPGTVALPRASGTVLLIDDEDSVRTLMRHVLAGCGLAVVEARGGVEAVELAAAHRGRFDLLVSDMVLPDLGGREVAGRVRASHPEAKILFVSGYPEDEAARQGGPAADAAFLQKPFAPAALAAKVRELLEDKPG